MSDQNALEVQIRYHHEKYPGLQEIEVLDNGDFIDLRAAETVRLSKGEFKLIPLGVSIKAPDGYYCELVPRSSTFKNFGILQANSIGIIDESYQGDDDIWMFPAFATRETEISLNDRICQFRVVKKSRTLLKRVDKLESSNRGGFGSTGR